LNKRWRKGIRTAKKNGNKIIKLIMSSRSLHHRINVRMHKCIPIQLNPCYIGNIATLFCNNN
jgi:hypothetical protein